MSSSGGSSQGAASGQRRSVEGHWRTLLALCVVLPLPQADSAKVYEKVLGKDDALFVRQLSAQGYGDLADLVLKAISSAGGAGGKSTDADLLRLELEQDRINREPDPIKRVALLEALVKSREDFAAAHPGTPEATRIQNGQQELYLGVGEAIAAVVQEGKSPDVETLKKRGIELLEKAITGLGERHTALVEAVKDIPTPDEEHPLTDEQQALVDEKMLNTYRQARSNYFLALLYAPGSYERTVITDRAINILLDFQLDYPDQLMCYEGYIYEGLCHKAAGNLDSAASSFDEAIRLRERFEQTRAGVFQMNPEAADIVSSAVLQKMLLFSEQSKHAEALAVAQDFMNSTVEPWTALKGLAILSEQATIQRALGDEKGVAATAKTLMEVDPNGPGGQRGRELLGEGSAITLGAIEVLRLAESSTERDPVRAIELCQQALALARGTAEQANVGSRAALTLGALYFKSGQLHEAVVAWDTAADRYPDGKDGPECLWRAINGYLQLQGAERRAIYKTLAQERLAELTRRYPNHTYAASASLIEGRQAEAEGDFARAADIYERIAPGSAAYEEALFRAGDAWVRHARKQFQDGKTSDAKKTVDRAEKALQKAITALDAAAGKTLETTVQERMRGFAFGARLSLANLYLVDGVDRPGDVVTLLKDLDKTLGEDSARMSAVWELRFRALNEQKKLDEAMVLFETQAKLNPSASWLAAAARTLAPILDARGSELRKTDPRSAEADRLWRKAASNYLLAIKGQLDGREAVNVDTLEDIADRLFVFGLYFERVPDTVESFVEWSGPRLSGELLEATVRAYEMCLPLTPSYRTVMKLARTLGFLGRWEESTAQYAALFEREQFADPVTKTINQSAVVSKPELIFAYIEWGVAERELGLESQDKSRLTRASGIFEALVIGTAKEGKLWWQAKYYQLQTLVDRGDYEVADISLKSLQLNWEHFDGGKYGLEERFNKLKDELSTKVFSKK